MNSQARAVKADVRLFCLSLLLFVVLGYEEAAAGHGSLYGTDVPLTNFGDEIDPDLVTDSAGNLYVAYQDVGGGIDVSWSSDNGEYWQFLKYFYPVDEVYREPSLAISKGISDQLIIAYIVDDGTNPPYPEVATAPLGEYVFTYHTPSLPAGGEGFSKPVVWTDYNRCFLVCERTVSSGSDTYECTFWMSWDQGTTWELPQTIFGATTPGAWIDPDGVMCYFPDNLVVVCYNDWDNTLYQVISDDYGISFSDPQPILTLPQDPVHPVDPALASCQTYVEPGFASICTFTYPGPLGDDDIGWIRSWDGGVTWDSTITALPGRTDYHEFGAVIHADADQWEKRFHLAYTCHGHLYYIGLLQDLTAFSPELPEVVDDAGFVSHAYHQKAITSNGYTGRPAFCWVDCRSLYSDFGIYFDRMLQGSELFIPLDFPTIQSGIDAAQEGDSLHVDPGTYHECLYFPGKDLTLTSLGVTEETVVDGMGAGSVVTFDASCTQDTVLEGFTLRNGNALYGGGIYCHEFASPEIIFNIITENTAFEGGGIWCSRFQHLIKGNHIEDNTASAAGGGIWCSYLDPASATFEKNTITGNMVDGYTAKGGGIYCTDGAPLLENNVITKNSVHAPLAMGGGVYVRDAYLLCTNNTLADNYAEYKGGGFRGSACTGLIRNSIFWNNDAPDYPQLHSATSDILVEYCDVEGGCTGEGNIDVEPVFTNPSCNDYSLTWRSACINMGTNQDAPETDREGDSRPFMGTVDMGAYEFRGTHSLQAWTLSLEASTGGQIELMLNGGEFNAFRQYLIMGSMSGKVPGNPLPDGGGFFFLNLDLFSSIVWQLTNTIHFQDFLGNLDAFGKATALIDLPPIPDFAGETMHLAFVLLGPPWDFASNPLDIEVID